MTANRRSPEKRTAPSLFKKAGRGVVSWATILLLALNVLASAVLPAHSISSSPNDGAELLSQGLEICSEHGQVQPASGLPGDHGDHEIHCVFCLPLMHGGLALPVAAATVDKSVETKDRFALATEQQQIIPARFRSFAAPRAPPLA